MKMEIVFKDGKKETYDNVVSFNVTDGQTSIVGSCVSESEPVISAGELFEVNPQKIDRTLFKNNHPLYSSTSKLAWVKSFVYWALKEADEHPEKYGASFYTMVPKRNWKGEKKVAELKAYAENLGGHVADWVEQGLEWAQRISNGESWDDVCNKDEPDCDSRLIERKVWSGRYQRVGKNRLFQDRFRDNGGFTSEYGYDDDDMVSYTVPLVVINKN